MLPATTVTVTVTVLFTTPGVDETAGFPQLSPMPGQFLAKDIMLLAASIWVLGDSLAATSRRTRAPEVVDAAAH